MISFVKGVLVAKELDAVVVEVGGIGYRIAVSARSISRMPEPGNVVQLLTRLQVREDSLVLFGFTSAEEKTLFERLTSVSSVGPKVALSVLSTYDPSEVVAAIAAQDLAVIQRVPGIGKKMASRIVLELRESFDSEMGAVLSGVSAQAANAKKGAMEALLSMGFSAEEAELSLKGAPDEVSETVLLQYALKRLGK